MKKILAVAVIIAISGVLSLDPHVTLQNGWDKTAHFIFYGVATVLLYYFIGSYTLAVTSIAASIFEYLQRFVPGRLSSIFDLLFSLFGVLTGYFIILLIYKKVKE